MLNPHPVANIFEIIKSLFISSLDNERWELKGYQTPLWHCNGAEILSMICQQNRKNLGNKISIMLPSYFCGQSLRYLRYIDVELIFYSLEVDLNPNYKNILSLLEKKKPDFFLHVHYFGRVSSQEMTRDLCNTYNMLMIEDCAHIIHPSVANQWFGDYLFFSPHKFFPVKNGGVLYSKEAMKNNNNHVRSFFPFFWYLKKYFSLIKYKNNINCNIQWNSKSEKFNFFLPSSAEINLIKASSRNLKEISKIRVLNKDKLLAVFSRKSDLRQLVIYDSSDVPYIVGVKCDDISFAKNLCTSLRKLNCPVMKWPDLPNEILKIECQNDINLIKSSIFFFIHEQIDINKYTKIISQAINEY